LKRLRRVPSGEVKKAVVIAVVSTFAAELLCVVAYRHFIGPPKVNPCSCTQDPVGAAASPRTAAQESLTVALATLAAANTGRTPGEVEAPGIPAPPVESGSEATDPPSPAPAPPTKEERAVREQADVWTLDEQLRTEEVDPRWASKSEAAVTEFIGRDPSLHLDEVTCRETLCRARVSHLDPGAHDSDMERLLAMPFIEGQAATYSENGDPRTTLVYFSRRHNPISVLQEPVVLQPPPGTLTAEP
jgi:hypothetical protein